MKNLYKIKLPENIKNIEYVLRLMSKLSKKGPIKKPYQHENSMIFISDYSITEIEMLKSKIPEMEVEDISNSIRLVVIEIKGKSKSEMTEIVYSIIEEYKRYKENNEIYFLEFQIKHGFLTIIFHEKGLELKSSELFNAFKRNNNKNEMITIFQNNKTLFGILVDEKIEGMERFLIETENTYCYIFIGRDMSEEELKTLFFVNPESFLDNTVTSAVYTLESMEDENYNTEINHSKL